MHGIIDIAVLRIRISGRKSRSANNSRKLSDVGLWRQKYQPLYGIQDQAAQFHREGKPAHAHRFPTATYGKPPDGCFNQEINSKRNATLWVFQSIDQQQAKRYRMGNMERFVYGEHVVLKVHVPG